jgi:histidine triad (HIT) family protein
MSDCVFCGIIAHNDPHHEILWQDEAHIAFLTIRPLHEGHLLVVPKEHAPYVFDLEEQAYEQLMKAVRTVAAILKRATGKEHIVLEFEGFGVNHVHAHLIPTDRPEAGYGMRDAHDASPEELARVANTLKPAFSV